MQVFAPLLFESYIKPWYLIVGHGDGSFVPESGFLGTKEPSPCPKSFFYHLRKAVNRTMCNKRNAR